MKGLFSMNRRKFLTTTVFAVAGIITPISILATKKEPTHKLLPVIQYIKQTYGEKFKKKPHTLYGMELSEKDTIYGKFTTYKFKK